MNDLPLSGYVSYSHDISNYVSNMLNGITYENDNIMSSPLSSVISSMSDCIALILQRFGGSTTSHVQDNFS